MALDIATILARVESHALTLGRFGSVNTSEPKSKPRSRLTYAVWVNSIDPIRERSGLASTTVLVEFQGRIYTSMVADPPDMIDPEITSATDALLAAYTGDFTLGGAIADVDLLGAYSDGVHALAGYLEQDGTIFRVMDVWLPCVVNDLWAQAA